jgi:hypothetical protein
MKTEIIKSIKGDLSFCKMDENEKIQNASDFLDLMVICPSDTIVINKENINGDFFDLKTGIAGDILQKISNYKKRLVILGDYKDIKSKALNDFIYESNITGQVVFADEIKNAVKLLKYTP